MAIRLIKRPMYIYSSPFWPIILSRTSTRGGKSTSMVSHKTSKSTESYPWINRLRMPMICGQGIEGYFSWVEELTFAHASPTISISRIRASSKTRLRWSSALSLPAISYIASFAWSSICWSLIMSLCCVILHICLSKNLVAKIFTQKPRGIQIDLASDYFTKLNLQSG